DVVEEAEAHPTARVGMMPRRAHRAERVLHRTPAHRIHRVQYTAGRAHRDIPGIESDVGIARAEIRVARKHVTFDDPQRIGRVAQQEFVRARIAGWHARGLFDEPGAGERTHHGIEALGALRVVAPFEVLAILFVRHQASRHTTLLSGRPTGLHAAWGCNEI